MVGLLHLSSPLTMPGGGNVLDPADDRGEEDSEAISGSAETGPLADEISISNPPPSSARTPERKDLQLTHLALGILAESGNPVLNVDHEVLQVSGAVFPVAGLHTIPSRFVVPAQPHSRIWAQAISNRGGVHDLELNNMTLGNTSFASIDVSGQNIVEFKLSSLDPNGLEETAEAHFREMRNLRSVTTNFSASSDPLPTTHMPITPAIIAVPDKLRYKNPATPHGFTLSGSIRLFNIINAQLYTYHGVSSLAVTEMVIISEPPNGSTSLNSLVPPNQGTSLDIMLAKPYLTFHAFPSPIRGRIGVWLEADFIFQGSLAFIREDMTHIFGPQADRIHVSSQLSLIRDWSRPFKPESFMLTAFIPRISAKFCDGLIEYTSLGLSISMVLIRGYVEANENPYKWSHDFSGELKFRVPGSVTGLLLDYNIVKLQDLYILYMSSMGKQWMNAFGVRGLHLSNVQFKAGFIAGEGEQLNFDVKALLETEDTTIELKGFLKNDIWGFTASASHLDWASLCCLYEEIFDTTLQDFPHNVMVSNLTLTVKSATKEIIFSGNVVIQSHEYSFTEATITLSNRGLEISAIVKEIHFEEATIEAARLDVFIGRVGDADPKRQGTGTAVRFVVSGVVKLFGRELDANLYLGKQCDGKTVYTIAGAFTQAGRISDLGKWVRGFEGKNMDLALKDVEFFVCNGQPASQCPNPRRYPVSKGVQICAILSEAVPNLHTVLRSNPTSLVMRLAIDGDNAILGIHLTSERSLTFAPNVKSGGVSIGVNIGELPNIFVEAPFSVSVSGRKDPLDFKLKLEMDELKATGYSIDCSTNWTNPFEICSHLIIEQELLLEAEIDYELAEAGVYPSKLCFQGGLNFGNVQGRATLVVSKHPKEGLIQLQVGSIGVNDIITIASTLLKRHIPQPAKNPFEVNLLRLKMSSGTTFEQEYYPRGIFFDAEMVIFQKVAKVQAQISDAIPGVSMTGTIENFDIGPLHVTGTTQPNPEIDFIIGPSIQRLSIRGKIWLLGVNLPIYLIVDTKGELTARFNGRLTFVEPFSLVFHAKAVGIGHPSNDVDFKIDGEMGDDMIRYVVAQVNTKILATKHAIDDGVEKATATLARMEKKNQSDISGAKARLEEKKGEWDKKQVETKAAVAKKREDTKTHQEKLRKDVDEAKKALDEYILGLQKGLEDQMERTNLEITRMENEMTETTKMWDGKIDGYLASLHQVQENFSRKFGDAEYDIEAAKARVLQAQDRLNGITAILSATENDYQNASWWGKLGKDSIVAELETERAVELAAFDVAEGILSAAVAITKGADYVESKVAVKGAQGLLDKSRELCDKALDEANTSLEAGREVQNNLVQGHVDALRKAKSNCDKSECWDAAKRALTEFAEVKFTLKAEEHALLTKLLRCTEYIAFKDAQDALDLAKAAVDEIDIARAAVSEIGNGTGFITALGHWMVKVAGNVLDIREIRVFGSLKGIKERGEVLKAIIKGSIVGVEFDDVEIDFRPGELKGFVENLYSGIKGQVQKDTARFFKQ